MSGGSRKGSTLTLEAPAAAGAITKNQKCQAKRAQTPIMGAVPSDRHSGGVGGPEAMGRVSETSAECQRVVLCFGKSHRAKGELTAMFPPNAYRIRFATADDADTLSRLADQGAQQSLAGRVLIGQMDGTPAAAISLDDDRVITDPSRRTDRVVAALRIRAGAIRAFEATPSLRERLAAAFASYRGSNVVRAPVSRQGDAEDEPERLAA
jgi:hypothetical protein